MKPVLIFDMDGTLYAFQGGSFERSVLKTRMHENAETYIAKKLSKSNSEAREVLQGIKEKYGQEISIGLEKEFGIDRYDYFNSVWNIDPRGIVEKTEGLRNMLSSLAKTYTLVLVSDAPKVWIENVLKELDVYDLFRNTIYSGEGNRRKGFGNAFTSILEALEIKPENCIAVGDQEATDILPAKKIGMRAVFVNSKERSSVADATIVSIADLPAALESL